VTLLEEAQAEIAALEPHPHYLSQYRAAETNYWQLIPDWIADDVAERRPARCLDIGCAYGTLLTYIKRLSGCAVDATDFADIYLSPVLQRRYSIRFAVSNIELDPFPWPPGYDIILLTEVLEHFNFQPTPTLKKIRDLLLPWGRLYLSTPDAATWVGHTNTTAISPLFRSLAKACAGGSSMITCGNSPKKSWRK